MRATKRVLLPAAMAVAAIAAAVMSPAQARDGQRQSAPAKIERIAATEISSQTRRRSRPATRLRVYRQNLPPNAVRTCDAWYVQEFRPSGPVIVPRMRCRWIRG